MLKAIGDILQRHNLGSALIRGVSAAQMVEKTNELLEGWFGASIKGYAEAAYVKQKTLTIIARGSVVSQELRFKEKQLLGALKQAFGAQSPTRIAYRVERLPSTEKYTTL